MASVLEPELPAIPPTTARESNLSLAPISLPPTEPTQENTTLVLSPTLITTEFDLLRFHAAAFDQLPSTLFPTKQNAQPTQPEPTSNLLISSPYNTPSHYLTLTPHLPPTSTLLALALTALKPSTPTYATTPYDSALNFNHVLSVLRDLVRRNGMNWPETRFYVVVFRSQLKADIDMDYLYKLDSESHAEACASGGLLKYWFGKGDGERRNLATCEF